MTTVRIMKIRWKWYLPKTYLKYDEVVMIKVLIMNLSSYTYHNNTALDGLINMSLYFSENLKIF